MAYGENTLFGRDGLGRGLGVSGELGGLRDRGEIFSGALGEGWLPPLPANRHRQPTGVNVVRQEGGVPVLVILTFFAYLLFRPFLSHIGRALERHVEGLRFTRHCGFFFVAQQGEGVFFLSGVAILNKSKFKNYRKIPLFQIMFLTTFSSCRFDNWASIVGLR